ncbi:MAG: thioredoxin [Pelagibacteraceae bacterium]|nr:thioredoxin [Pelagibacteraceae bacterium]|tara:strand:+ start:1135 stop:2007 length:873 start_codon:yes stop_codon:yes gene_type:complete
MELIKDISQENFLKEVVEESKTLPVLVDFWAPWCGPCKQLTPLLEKIVNENNGKILLAKINVDDNKELAAKLNVQSIPTVYAFVNGKPIDAFQGAQPEDKIRQLIAKMIELTPGNEIQKLLEEANSKFKEELFEEAQTIYEKLIGMDSSNQNIIIGLLRTYYQLKKNNEAIELYESLDSEIIKNDEIEKIINLIKSFNNPEFNEEELNEINNFVLKNPNDKKERFKLSNMLLKQQKIKEAFDHLLLIYEQDPNWNDSAAKQKLLEYFEMLGAGDSNVIAARKKLSSMMFK